MRCIEDMRKVLIIEDDFSFAQQLATILTHSGFQPHIEDSCEGGVSYFIENEQDIDLILLDINFYGEPCGLNVLKKIRSRSQIWIGVMSFNYDYIELANQLGSSSSIRKNSECVNKLITYLKYLDEFDGFPKNTAKTKTIEKCDLELVEDRYFSVNSVKLSLPVLPYRILHMLYTKPSVEQDPGFPAHIYSSKDIQYYLNQGHRFDTGNIRQHIKTIRDRIEDIAPGCSAKLVVYDSGFGYRCPCSPLLT